MGYIVKRVKGSKASVPSTLRNRTFTSYDQARCEVRKYIRKSKTYNASVESMMNFSNPRLGSYGFTITKA